MINYNGELTADVNTVSINNRAFNYGDGVFETVKWSFGKLLFFEDHYFRLMASMRLLRMEIPMTFTLEFFQSQIETLLKEVGLFEAPARLKIFVYRNEGGLYEPETNEVSFIISAKPIASEKYDLIEGAYIVDLYKDHYISPSLLSTLKTNNKALNILASIYAKENDFNNCLLLNTNKKVVEAINGNLFLVMGNHLKTPPIEDGCLSGIMRKQLLGLLKKTKDYTVEEAYISPFELQKADELFITNCITGLQPITAYRKKNYTTAVSYALVNLLNETLDG